MSKHGPKKGTRIKACASAVAARRVIKMAQCFPGGKLFCARSEARAPLQRTRHSASRVRLNVGCCRGLDLAYCVWLSGVRAI